jgi:hypothetical protein
MKYEKTAGGYSSAVSFTKKEDHSLLNYQAMLLTAFCSLDF